MGIPAFFRQIIEKYPSTHYWNKNEKIKHFFIDFNSIIYDTFYALDKDEINKLSHSQFENFLIKKVIENLKKMIDIIDPTDTLYIALDGPAPRAKMIQQRWRRFKGYHDSAYKKSIYQKYDVQQSKHDWNPSINISPGTKFMYQLGLDIEKFLSKIKKDNLNIIFSDSNVPGEGEHKFLPMIRQLPDNSNNSENSGKIAIYSPDADLIVLAMATGKNNINILRKPRESNDIEREEYVLKNSPFLYLSINEYKKAFIERLEINNKNPTKIIQDYVFLTFLGGNDFVLPIPYLKIKEEQIGGIDILLEIYKKYINTGENYLVNIDEKSQTATINVNFLKKIFDEISQNEDYYMRGIQIKINKTIQGEMDEKIKESEADKTPMEIELSRFEHVPYASKLNPFHEEHKLKFEQINFMNKKHLWKQDYYYYFFNIINNGEINNEYNNFRTIICTNYLESLMWTLKYYFIGVPSWNWTYNFRAPPVASDIRTTLEKYIKNPNDLKFKLGTPYKPFDQLMMILPPQLGDILPKKYFDLMKNKLVFYYPINFDLDVLLGGKHIYAEPILPIINDNEITDSTKKLESKLSALEKKRNMLKDKPTII